MKRAEDGRTETERQPLLGQPRASGVERSRNAACSAAVLIAEVFERIAYYGLAGNLVLYLTESPLCWSNANAMSALLILQGTTYAFGLLGGWLADSVTGKYGCILLGFVIYIIGYTFMFLHGFYLTNDGLIHAAHPVANSTVARCHEQRQLATWCSNLGSTTGGCEWSLYMSIITIGIGTALVRTTLAPFGADQVKWRGPRVTQTFFTWYYWCINLGALVAYTGVAYVQQFVDFSYGYLIPCSCLGLSALVFIAGSRSYKIQSPVGSSLSNTWKAFKKSCSTVPQDIRHYEPVTTSASTSAPTTITSPVSFSQSGVNTSVEASQDFGETSRVKDVKSLKRLAIVFLLLLPYWICYFQMLGNTFLLQGLHMELRLGNGTADIAGFGVPAASLMLFNIAFLILALPLVDRWLYPLLSRRGASPTILARITVGMLFSALALAAAATVEEFRQRLLAANETIVQVIGNTWYDDVAPISVFVQIPQYALLGISEVFTCVTGMEYAYSRSPKAMEGIVMGCFWFVAGVGSLLGTGLMFAISSSQRSWNDCPDDLSAYFYALLALQLFGVVIFYVAGRNLDLDLLERCSPDNGRGCIAEPSSEHRGS